MRDSAWLLLEGGRGTRGLLLEDGGGRGGGAGVACAGRVLRRVDEARPGLHLPIDDGADKAWVAGQGLDWGASPLGRRGARIKHRSQGSRAPVGTHVRQVWKPLQARKWTLEKARSRRQHRTSEGSEVRGNARGRETR